MIPPAKNWPHKPLFGRILRKPDVRQNELNGRNHFVNRQATYVVFYIA
jgi:hypothetical protein